MISTTKFHQSLTHYRFAALIIDSSIIVIPLCLLQAFVLNKILVPTIERVIGHISFHPDSGLWNSLFAPLLASGVSVLILIVFSLLAGWLYFAIFEAGPDGATPGKKFCGIRVVDTEGYRVGLGRASARYWAKILSNLGLVGYFFNVFTLRRQALHDLVSGCVLVRTHYPPVPMIFVVTIVLMILQSQAQRFITEAPERKFADAAERAEKAVAWRQIITAPGQTAQMAGKSATKFAPVDPEYQESMRVQEKAKQKEAEKDIWEFFPEATDGPHANIGINGTLVNARVVLGIVYPAGNSISLAFFQEKLSPDEVAEFKRRGTLTSAVNLKRAVLVVSLDLVKTGKVLNPNDVRGYTSTFYSDGSSAPFYGSFRAASLSRERGGFREGEVVQVSGSGEKGGKMSFVLKGGGTAPAAGSNQVRWDISGDVYLFGSK